MLLALLLACGPPEIPEGAVDARYTLTDLHGEVVGEARLSAREGGRVERWALSQDDAEMSLQARLSPEGSWEAVVVSNARWERFALSRERGSWSRWRGLLREGGALTAPSVGMAEGYAEDALPGPESSLLAWSLLLDDRSGQLQALVDPRTGREVPFRLESREQRALADGRQATRLFAWTGSQGHTIWVDEGGRLLALDGLAGSLRATLDGFQVPELAASPEPDAEVEPLTVTRPDVVLGGQRDRPRGGESRGSILLIHGSGPGDRDGDYGPVHAGVFRQLSAALVAEGWEVLRYDKRGVEQSQPSGGGELESATLDDLVADAAAFGALGGPCRVVVGHSEGAAVAAAVAGQDPAVQGVILLAGPARRLDAVLLDQLPLVLRAQGATEAEIAGAGRAQRASLAALRQEREGPLSKLDPRQSAWLASHMRHDQTEALRALRVPLLAIYGADDLQVPPAAEVPVLQAAMGARAEIHVLPDLDHMLSPTRAPLGLGAYHDPDRRLDARVISGMIEWLGNLVCL